MTQILSSTNKLTAAQTETCINNFAKIRHFTKVEKIFDGKPSFSTENIAEIKKLGLEPYKITKFANNYTIYKFSEVKPSESVEFIKQYNKNAKFKNLDERIEIVIVVDTDKIDKQNYLALQALYPTIHKELIKNKAYKMLYGGSDSDTSKNKDENENEIEAANKENENDQPENDPNYYIQYYKYISGPCFVTVMTTNHIEPAMLRHFHTRFLPCNYRVMSLYDDLYPLIGSKSKLWYGCLDNYEVIEHEDLYNGYQYSYIYDDEHLAKLLNANPGDLIVATQVLFEGRPYLEFVVKEVKTRNIDAEEVEE